ncbi:hypothetical protein GCM10017044_21510 [Kordiimonas sediminis]|uniref:HPt domain-containing protein n=1 Tax=Kordiimonas sediminis TaxID=1735581 RepID=A0A919E955_9PROT|nr:Hpt domain-containing protein [Kordiimonas sediminis]GHF26286.1 hypothetical protein GCM10017044_21510 [Kordiimonas sediminis]
MATESKWDESIVFDSTHFRDFTEGDPYLETDVLSIFIENAPTYLEALKSAGPGEWRTCAHKLKGAARSIGAWNLAREAERAEHRNTLGLDDPDRNVFIQELHARLETLIRVLEDEILPDIARKTAS